MAGNDKRTKVTLEVAVDDGSGSRALSYLRELSDALHNVANAAGGSSGGGSGLPPPGRPRGSALPSPPSPIGPGGGGGGAYGGFGGGGGGGGHFPPTPMFGGGNGPGGPGGGGGYGAMSITAQIVNIIAQTVHIIGNNITMSGNMGGGAPGLGAGGGMAPPGAGGGGGGGVGGMFPRWRTALANGGLGGFAAGTLASFLPFAPYALGGAMVHELFAAGNAQQVADAQFGAYRSGVARDAAYGRSGVIDDVQLDVQRARSSRAGTEKFWSSGLTDPFGIIGAHFEKMKADEERDMNMVEASRVFGGRMIAQAIFAPGSDARRRYEASLQNRVNEASTSNTANLAGLKDRAAAESDLDKGLGVFSGSGNDPFFQGLRSRFGGDAAMRDSVMAPLIQMMTGMNFASSPEAYRMMTPGMNHAGVIPYLAGDLSNRVIGGDLSAVGALAGVTETNALGGRTRKAGSAFDLAYQGLRNMNQFNIAGSNAALSQASARLSAAEGGDAMFSRGFGLGSASSIDNQVQALQAQRALMTANNAPAAAIAAIDAQIMGLRADAAQTRKSAYDMPYSQAGSIASSRFSQSSAQTAIIGYSGVSARANTGYAGQVAAQEAAVQNARARLSDPNVVSRMTPDERAAAEADLANAQRALVETRRNQGQDIYGETRSAIGATSAGVDVSISRASRFGGPGSVYSATQGRLGIADQEIAAERELLENMRRAGSTVKEQNDIRARITRLMGEREMLEEDAKREYYGGEQSLSGTRQRGLDVRGGFVRSLYGSQAAMGLGERSLSEIQGRLARNRSEQARLSADPRSDPNGSRMQELRTEEAELSVGATQARASLVEYSPDLATRRERRQLDVYSSIVQNTHAGYGDVRSIFTRKMALGGRAISTINSQRSRQLQQAKTQEERDAINEAADSQIAGIMQNEVIPAQSQLENGWQERLTSQVAGASGNFNMVESRFTRREASQFYGIANRAFGGNSAQSRMYRNQGRLWYDNYMHATQHPDSFTDSAASGNGTLHVEGGLTIQVEVKGPDGSIVGASQRQANIGSQIKATVERPSGVGG